MFDSSPKQAAMLTLEEEDRSALLGEKAYGKAALQPRVAFLDTRLCVVVRRVKSLLKGLLCGAPAQALAQTHTL